MSTIPDRLSRLAVKHRTDKGTMQPKNNPLSPKRYTPHYNKLFSEMREQPITLFEIGIAHGYSLKMWEEYFPAGMIYGIDTKDSKRFDSKRVKTAICKQQDQAQLTALLAGIDTPLDIVIDDGSHVPADQIASFEVLFPALRFGGYYAIEDLHTHYVDADRLSTGMSFWSLLLANLNNRVKNLPIASIKFYRGLVIIQKSKRKLKVSTA